MRPISLIESVLGLGESTVTGAITGVGGAIAGTLAGRAIASKAGLITGSNQVQAVDRDGNDIPGKLIGREAKDVFDYLEELWKTREPFSIVTALRRYDNMIISSLSVPRSKSVGSSLQFSINCEEIRIVTSAVIRIPQFQLSDEAKAGGQSNSKLGKAAATEEENSNASLLFQGFKKVGFL